MKRDERTSLIHILQEQFPQYTRAGIKAKLLAGAFKIDGETVYDPHRHVPADARIEEVRRRYVSRGGLKLEYALKHWNIDAAGKVLLDAGASSGGFTDCLLQSGALLVHAVDVGYNQIDFSLRRDDRVQVHERTNIMHCSRFDPVPEAAVADLSFRSIVTAAPHILSLTKDKWGIVLIKPQFELSKEEDNFSGIIKSRETLSQTLQEVASGLIERGVTIRDLCRSPIKGRKGNTEFFGYISLDDKKTVFPYGRIDEILSQTNSL